ncbi:coiled-coil domain-containing protein 50 isoform X2 [Carettochelys insculpta]|uniref:coiled-coil domain-containing protein 50 isoform X2 n=1 Tax=Carettochelys insculpta TaxID=44489 RepID=UPI003EB7C088
MVRETSFGASAELFPWPGKDHLRGSAREQVSEYSRPRRARSSDRRACEQRDPQRASLALSDKAIEHERPAPEESRSSSQQSKTRDGQQRSRERQKPRSQDRPRRPPSLDLDRTADYEAWDDSSNLERKSWSREKSRRPPSLDLDRPEEHKAWDHSSSWERQERKLPSQERPRRPPSLDLGTEPRCANWEGEERRQLSQERPWRPPALQLDLETEQGARGPRKSQQKRERNPVSKERARRPPSPDLEAAWDQSHSWLSNPENHRSQCQDRPSPAGTCEVRLRDAEELHRRGEESDFHRAGRRPRTSTSPHAEYWERDRGCHRDPGMRVRGTKDALYAEPRAALKDQELYDAEIARRLQEEELLANQVDKRAAQVAQDEEIARLLMAEEKKAYKKTKEREKSSFDKRRQDHEWKHDTHESARPRSRERHEPPRPKSDKPARPPPPSVAGLDDFDHTHSYVNQPTSMRQFSKPESSPKGVHYKQ